MSTEEQRKPFGIDFIDPLFAVSVHIGLTEGIMNETWFHEMVWPSGKSTFTFLTFSLGFATLLLSWLGYHQSIKSRPMKRGIGGIFRFLLDVLLVVMYAVLLVQYRNFRAVLGLLAVIYAVFAVWDIFKIVENSGTYTKSGSFFKKYGREVVTGASTTWFVLLWVLADQFRPGLLLTLALVGTVGYRLAKPLGGKLPDPSTLS